MVRIILVGCGFMGRMHANVYRLLPNAELVAVVDHRAAKAEEFSKAFGVPGFSTMEQALAEVPCEAVDLCLPTYLHADFTIRAAQQGKHVICEKPMALTLAEADAMIQATQNAGVQLLIGHCIRFWPEYALLKEIVDDQRLGNLRSINLTRFGQFPSWSSENWLADESKSGGGVLDMHIHDSDFMLFLLGQPESSSSFGTVDHRGASHVFTTCQYEGCVAHLEGGWNLPQHTPFKMAFRAIFDRGAVIMDAGPMAIYQDGQEPAIPEFRKMDADGGGNISDLGGYFVELEHFVECIQTGQPSTIVTPGSSRQSLEFTLQEIAAIKQR
jgi:predicted dehydrogenase